MLNDTVSLSLGYYKIVLQTLATSLLELLAKLRLLTLLLVDHNVCLLMSVEPCPRHPILVVGRS
jgi:hypothetical protein